jgi:hypothetical protein
MTAQPVLGQANKIPTGLQNFFAGFGQSSGYDPRFSISARYGLI